MDHKELFQEALRNIGPLHSSGSGIELGVSIKDLSKLIDGDGDNMPNRLTRGILRIQSGMYTEGLDDLNEAIDSEPELNWTAYINRVVINAQTAKDYLREGKLDERVADQIKEAQATASLYATVYGYRGLAESKLGQYEEAAEDLDVSLMFNPDNAGLHGIMSDAYLDIGIVSLSELHAIQQKSIIENPGGTLDILSRQYVESAADGDGNLETSILDEELLMLRGLPRISDIDFPSVGNDPDSTILSATTSIKRGYFDTAPFVERAIAYAQSKMYPDAIKDLTEAVKIDYVSEMQELTELAVGCIDDADECLTHPRGGQRAIEYLNTLVMAASIFSIVHRVKGYVLLKSEQYDEAAEDFSKSLMFDPDDSDAYFYRGTALGMLGRSEEAIADLKKGK